MVFEGDEGEMDEVEDSAELEGASDLMTGGEPLLDNICCRWSMISFDLLLVMLMSELRDEGNLMRILCSLSLLLLYWRCSRLEATALVIPTAKHFLRRHD